MIILSSVYACTGHPTFLCYNSTMRRKTRLFLFIFIALLFFVVAPLTVLYSLGWRFDWSTKEIVQPGIFYFKVLPRNTHVYLTPTDGSPLFGEDGTMHEKTDFFFGSALIENLLPKKYKIIITKEGFHSWQKTLATEERQVTEAKNIVLIPQNPSFTRLTQNVQDVFFAPDEKTIILKERTSVFLQDNSYGENGENLRETIWSLKLFDMEKSVKTHIITEYDILSLLPNNSDEQIGNSAANTQETLQLLDVLFDTTLQQMVLKTAKGTDIQYYLVNIDQMPFLVTPLLLGKKVTEVAFDPQSRQLLLVLDGTTLTQVAGVPDTKLKAPTIEQVITFTLSGNTLYYLASSGFLFKTTSSLLSPEKLNTIPLSLQENRTYAITVSGAHILVNEDNVLFLFDYEKRVFEKISESVGGIRFSRDNKKIALFNDHEIWLRFFEPTYDQPQRQEGERVFLTRFSETIQDVFWFSDHYVIFAVGDTIKVAEIDDRDRINIVDLAVFPNPHIFWSSENKRLFVLSEEDFFNSEKLIP